MMHIELKDLIEIAKAGYDKELQQFYNFDKMEMLKSYSTYKLYMRRFDVNEELPKQPVLTLFHRGIEGFVEIKAELGSSFNHLAAIRKMAELGLIMI